jgi:cytochrome c553
MWGLSHNLTDAQIQQLATYFSSQPVVPASGMNPTGSERGDQIFHHGVPDSGVPACETCHGAQGQGAGPIPRIAGQHADYIIKQLQVFQRTDERPRGAAMKVVAHGLAPQDMVAVANYLQGLAWSTASK